MNIRLRNDVSEINTLSGFVEEFGARHDLPRSVIFQVNLALEEVVTNVISYAFEDEAAHEIEVRLALDRNTLTAEIEDGGRPFDPTAADHPDLDAPLEERPIGGLGIHLVRNLFDDLEYRREDGRNRLVLKKKIMANIP